jgi:hypothetical protein
VAEPTWIGCPKCGSEPEVVAVSWPDGDSTPMRCATCQWTGKFGECWKDEVPVAAPRPAEPFLCVTCGAGFHPGPRTARLLHGSLDFKELGMQCWVCARLNISVQREAREMGQYLGGE